MGSQLFDFRGVEMSSLDNTRVLILCAGNAARWGDYLGVPKQLIPFNGESLLERTERLLRGRGYQDISVISHDERLQVGSCSLFRPERFQYTSETFLSTRSLWGGMTLVLLGDVFYTRNAIDKIVSFKEGVHVFGRRGASLFTRSPYGEIFAFSFDRASAGEMLEKAERVCADAKAGGRGKIWELYRALAGFSLDEQQFEREIFVSIHDFTDDIDSPEEYERMAGQYLKYTSKSWLKKFSLYSGLVFSAPFQIAPRFCRRLRRML
ncbi:MAG: NTP transferase domain-containing protein [Mariniblastus sp.]|nr:NTP transferase domain-containing protein [Mariniblastus sp.]